MLVIMCEKNGKSKEIARCTTYQEADEIIKDREKLDKEGFYFYAGTEGAIDSSIPKLEW